MPRTLTSHGIRSRGLVRRPPHGHGEHFAGSTLAVRLRRGAVRASKPLRLLLRRYQTYLAAIRFQLNGPMNHRRPSRQPRARRHHSSVWLRHASSSRDWRVTPQCGRSRCEPKYQQHPRIATPPSFENSPISSLPSCPNRCRQTAPSSTSSTSSQVRPCPTYHITD